MLFKAWTIGFHCLTVILILIHVTTSGCVLYWKKMEPVPVQVQERTITTYQCVSPDGSTCTKEQMHQLDCALHPESVFCHEG